MDPLARLTAPADIANLVARRCRRLDAQDWAVYAECHTADVVSWAIGPERGLEQPTPVLPGPDRVDTASAGCTVSGTARRHAKHDGHWLIASRRLVRTRVERSS